MIRDRFVVPVVLALSLTAPAVAFAQPAPILPDLFPFPGAFRGPDDGASAGVGFADRWLGDEPFDNPAADPGTGVRVTPQMLLVSRQDLHANNRDVDDGGPAFDLAGARGSLRLGTLALSAFVSQPVMRVDNIAFTIGRAAIPSGVPAAVAIDGTARELRGGLAASLPALGGRVGVGAEFSRREDEYVRTEVSGSPDAGESVAAFDGSAFGATVGGRWQRTPDDPLGWTAGAALRWSGSLEVTGAAESRLLSGDSTTAIASTRDAGFEGGAGVRVTVARGCRLLLAVGGASARAWEGVPAHAPGAVAEWRLAADLRSPDVPWIVRVGVGQEIQPGTPEPRAGHVALGFGWRDEDLRVDVGVVRRSIARGDLPRAHDDRVVASVGLDF